jgi:hypothetical protein
MAPAAFRALIATMLGPNAGTTPQTTASVVNGKRQ